MKSNLNIIKEACVRANPEIMELKNGCLIEVWWLDNPNEEEPDETVEFTDRTMRNNGKSDSKYSQIIEDNTTGTVKILGRPIRLADILHTFGKLRPDIMIVEAKEDGFLARKEFAMLMCDWKFIDDSLDHQSPETIDFIASLLTNNEK